MEKEIELLKRYFKNKVAEGIVTLNGEDVIQAFNNLIASIEFPKNEWIEHKGLDKPLLLDTWFGMIEFRDGEKRIVNFSGLPEYMWYHTEEPEVMSVNSVERRRKWNNQIVRFIIHEI